MTPRGRFFIQRALWRATVFTLALGAGVLALRLTWGWLAEKRLGEARGALAKRELPVPLEQESVEDERNAAIPFMAAVQALNPKNFRSAGGQGAMFTPLFNEFAWSELERGELRRTIDANGEAWGLLAQAFAKPGVSWEIPPPPALAGEMSFADKVRTLEDLLMATAVVARLEERDEDAAQALETILKVDRIVGACPALEAQAVGVFARARVITFVERFGYQMAVGKDEGKGREAKPSTLRRVIALLEDDVAFHRQLVLACERQMVTGRDVAPWNGPISAAMGEGSEGRGELGNWWYAPLLADERRRALESHATWLPVAVSETYETYRLMPMFRVPAVTNLRGVVRATSENMDSRWAQLIQQRSRAILDGRAAAVLLAARWAEQELGTAPATAETLVPRYLPVAPVDLFAVDGRPLRYRLDPTGPTVWSVGANGVDEDALLIPLSRGRGYDQPDMVYGAAWRAARGTLGSGVGPAGGPGPGMGWPGFGRGGRGRGGETGNFVPR